jgi:predicted DNA-binding protein YlxM (UPF0122 family)
MEKIVRQGLLYDFYGPLLTDHQQEVYESLVYDNLSLGEIGQEYGISRQAAHDIIKRSDKILEEYEDKLHLIERFADNKNGLKHIKELLDSLDTKDTDTITKINTTIDDMLEKI